MMRLLLILFLSLAFSCGDQVDPGLAESAEETTTDDNPEDTTQDETGGETGEETGGETGGETGEETGGETGEETGGETGENPDPQPDVLRFVVLGDGGEGNDTQFLVADVMQTVCEERGGCEFALYLGDNFYDTGITEGLDDPQFHDKFELPYANLSFPFYVVLGNHDYGLTSIRSDKAAYEVAYHDLSDKWHMPNRYYSVRHDNLEVFGIDTNAFMTGSLMWDVDYEEQWDWFHDAVANSDAQWKIAFGHHPYISNGSHGNAGSYEGYSWLPYFNGAGVKEFMDTEVCGNVDIYFAGHDHTRQWLHPRCGTEFVVSGAAAKVTDLANRGNPTYFEDDLLAGFMLVEIQDNMLTGEFFNTNGERDFSRYVIQE